jgi:hypothetical protein
MAVTIPIISEFDGKGIKSAIAEFKQLEGAGAKAQFALKKAAVPAAAAVAGLTAALGVSVKAAMEDAAAQDQLANVLKRSAMENEDGIRLVEEFISAQSRLTAVADDQLRPAFAELVNATGSANQAQDLLIRAQDIAAATGNDLTTVVTALAKGVNGSTTALYKLDPSLRTVVGVGAEFDDVLNALTIHQGAAADAANTTQGKMKNLTIQLDEAKESIGAALIPAVTALLDKLIPLATWMGENSKIVLILAGVIGGLAVTVLAANAAIKVYNAYQIIAAGATKAWAAIQTAFNAVMTANPIGLVVIAIAALVAALVLAYNKSETFRNAVDAMFKFIKIAIGESVEFIKGYLNTVLGFYKSIFNGIASLWNSTIGKLSFTVPEWVPGFGGKGFSVPKIPMLADGGIVTGPTLAMIGEQGPEAVVPLDRGMGMGNVTININANVADANLGDVIVNALRQYNRRSGPINVAVA